MRPRSSAQPGGGCQTGLTKRLEIEPKFSDDSGKIKTKDVNNATQRSDEISLEQNVRKTRD